MHTLGINAAYHDCAACLVQNGSVVAAAEEERFTRVKHGKRPLPFTTWQLPFHAIDYCLREAGIDLASVDHIAYSYAPVLLLGPYAGTRRSACRWTPRQLAGAAPHHLKERFRGARHDGPYQWHFVEHHLAHEVTRKACAWPAAGDADTAMGAALRIDARQRKSTTRVWRMNHAFLGPAFERCRDRGIPDADQITLSPGAGSDQYILQHAR